MVSPCCIWLAKYLLCIINFLFFLVGTIAVGIGLWMVIDKASLIALLKPVDAENAKEFSEPHVIDYLAYAILIIGIIMFIFGILGYCSVLHESRGLLITYAVLLTILLILEIVGLGFAIFYRTQLEKETKHHLETSVNEFYANKDNPGHTLMWNKIMSQYSCCGVTSHNDFLKSESWRANKNATHTIPPACCVLKDVKNIVPKDETCPSAPTNENSYMNVGCFDKLSEKFNRYQIAIILALIALIFLQFVEICFAIGLAKEFSKYDDMRL